MSDENDALGVAISRLRKNSALRVKIANGLLTLGLMCVLGLAALIWFGQKVEAQFTKELVVEMTASPKTLPDALWLTHNMSVLRAKADWQLMLLSLGTGAFIGAGIGYRRKGANDVLLDLVDRVCALEHRVGPSNDSG